MKLIPFYILLIITHQTKACDICGCGISGTNINGIIPQFNKNIIGLRTMYNAFQHPNTPENYNGTNRVIKDNYLSTDLWFRYYPNKRLQMVFALPYKSISREQSNKTIHVNGIGDATMMLNYSILKPNDSTDQNFMWWAGGGLKIPTGKYQQRDEEKTMYPIGLQTGNGAYSFSLNNQMTYKKNKVIVNSVSQFLMNYKNELNFQLGNIYSTQLVGMYKKRIGCESYLIPNIGVEWIKSEQDKSYGIFNHHSGATTLSMQLGLDYFINSFFISANIKQPKSLNTYSSQPIQQLNGSFNLGYVF